MGTGFKGCPSPTPGGWRASIPAAVSFIGRSTEIETAAGLLARHRLVTLAGPGGAGKTRLAGEVAADQADRHPDGGWWVDLATVSDSTAEAEAVPLAARAPAGGGAPDQPFAGVALPGRPH